MTSLWRSHFSSELADLILIHDGQALWQLHFSDPEGRLAGLEEAPLPDWLRQPLREYVAGRLDALAAIPLHLEGTPFQRAVWQALQRIPAGETWSYARLAREVERPRAVRAVGNANGRNPVALVVPCHRVIASDGSLGGYSSGLPLKRRLLAHEGVASF